MPTLLGSEAEQQQHDQVVRRLLLLRWSAVLSCPGCLDELSKHVALLFSMASHPDLLYACVIAHVRPILHCVFAQLHGPSSSSFALAQLFGHPSSLSFKLPDVVKECSLVHAHFKTSTGDSICSSHSQRSISRFALFLI